MPTSVALTPHFETLTQQPVSSGRYNNVSEVVRDGLRLLVWCQPAALTSVHAIKSSRNSEAGSTAVTRSLSRARVHATYSRCRSVL